MKTRNQSEKNIRMARSPIPCGLCVSVVYCFAYRWNSYGGCKMTNLQEEAKRLEKIRNAMAMIENGITLSFHHWSKELDIPVEELQRAWAKHSYAKRKVRK